MQGQGVRVIGPDAAEDAASGLLGEGGFGGAEVDVRRVRSRGEELQFLAV